MFPLTDALKIKVLGVVSLFFVALLLGVVAYYSVQLSALNLKVTSQQEEIGGLRVNVATLTSANKQLSESIATQNGKVESLQEEAKQASLDSATAIAKARGKSSVWQDRYRKALTAPQVSADACVDLASKVNAYLVLRAEGGL